MVSQCDRPPFTRRAGRRIQETTGLSVWIQCQERLLSRSSWAPSHSMCWTTSWPSQQASFCDKVSCLVEEEKAVDVVHLDLSKAFDIVSHDILLEKLAAHSWGRWTLCWIKSWLDGWAQGVVVTGVTPSWWLVTSSVPRAQCWGQSCWISLSMIWMKGSSALSVHLQTTFFFSCFDVVPHFLSEITMSLLSKELVMLSRKVPKNLDKCIWKLWPLLLQKGWSPSGLEVTAQLVFNDNSRPLYVWSNRLQSTGFLSLNNST